MHSDRNRYRQQLTALAEPELRAGERIVALLPFATVPKLPKGPKGRKGKVRVGIRQSWQRYRPLVVTDQRLLIFESGRTPYARELLDSFPIDTVAIGPVTQGRWHTSNLALTLPDVGKVPFETGSRDDLAALRQRAVSAAAR